MGNISPTSVHGSPDMFHMLRRARAATHRQQVPGETLLGGSIAVLYALFGDVSVAATHPALSPNQDFSNPILQLHAPASSGWYGITQSPTSISFGKAGGNADESFVAAVFLFRIPTFPNSDAFTEYVREGVIKDSPSDRFDTIELNVQPSKEREYTCVRYHGISNDRKAHTSSLFKKQLRIENIALYC